jgi:hypothetical protein
MKGYTMKNKVEISINEYEDLLKSEAKLRLLEEGGVDNWEWYGESLEGLDEEYDEIDEIISSLS